MGFALEELGSSRCKEIALELFRLDHDYSGRSTLNGYCPIHGDKTTPSFAYNYAEDWFKCMSPHCGVGGDLVKLWCEVNGKEFIDFRKTYAPRDEDSGTLPRRDQRRKAGPEGDVIDKSGWKQARLPEAGPELFVDEADLAALPPLPDDYVRELEQKRGWHPEVMQRLDLRLFVDARKNRRVAIPVRDDQGRLCNIRLYQPGAASMKVISWFDQACKACGGKWAKVKDKKVDKKICVDCGGGPNDYGRTRLFPPPSAWQRSGLLWLVEGEPDCLCALSQGLNAVTQTAGCGTWRDEFTAAMAGRDVVICYDADKAGHKGAMLAAEGLAKAAKSVRVMVWPEAMGEVA